MKLKQISMTTSLTLLLFAGCASGPQIQEFPDTASASDELKTLTADMNDALKAQLNVASPHNYSEAADAYEDAKTSYDKQRDSKTVLHEIAKSRAYLRRANEVADMAHANMDEVLVARQQALDARAPMFCADDFQKADKKLRSVTSDLEKSDLTGASENRASLQATYLDLELQGIKQFHLNDSKALIERAEKDGAEKWAPQTLAQTHKFYQDSEAFITANRHDDARLKLKSNQLSQSAGHLLKITREARDSKKASPEDLALNLENKQNEVDQKKEELITEQELTQALGTENQSLESQRAFNERFETARKEFTKEEAEVYKQGGTLVIRLRGLEFPQSQAVLKSSNFPLLAKVQRVIKGFKNSSVIVEGHTDSQGGKEKNAKLSSERAQAVREYLVSNEAIPGNRVQAIGYDFQKPLATNKSAAGRAQNRRVDVLIKPEPQQPPRS